MIPNREECLKLIRDSGMLEHIIDHSLKVAEVALFISKELNLRGHSIDLALVEAAALLHDLTKTECLRTKEDHALTGSKTLIEMGFEKVGAVVREHIHLSKKPNPFYVSEEEIVNYADKRVKHNQVVTLEERFEDLRQRYGKNPRAIELLEDLKKSTLEIEKKIFSILKIDPNDLLHRLSSTHESI